jgi:hypothetical protein
MACIAFAVVVALVIWYGSDRFKPGYQKIIPMRDMSE